MSDGLKVVMLVARTGVQVLLLVTGVRLCEIFVTMMRRILRSVASVP